MSKEKRVRFCEPSAVAVLAKRTKLNHDLKEKNECEEEAVEEHLVLDRTIDPASKLVEEETSEDETEHEYNDEETDSTENKVLDGKSKEILLNEDASFISNQALKDLRGYQFS